MKTYIKFSGMEGDSILADEDMDAILNRWQQAGGQPFEVKMKGDARAIVNPERIACLREAKSGKVHAL
jgi:hypothetical protein